MGEPGFDPDAVGDGCTVVAGQAPEEMHEAIGDPRVRDIFHLRGGIGQALLQDLRDVEREERLGLYEPEQIVGPDRTQQHAFDRDGDRRALARTEQ